MLTSRLASQRWFARPANLVALYEVPVVASVLGVAAAIAALIRHAVSVELFIAAAWFFGLAIAWLCRCLLRPVWARCVAGLLIAGGFFGAGIAIAHSAPLPPPWMHVGTIALGKEPATGGVRLIARIEFENDSDDPALVVTPSAWLFAKPEDGLTIAAAAERVRAFAAVAPAASPAPAGPHELHHFYILGPMLTQREADDQIRRGARFFVAGTIVMSGTRPDARAPFCAFAGATANGAVDGATHECPR